MLLLSAVQYWPDDKGIVMMTETHRFDVHKNIAKTKIKSILE